MRRHFSADHAACTRAVVDYKLLTQSGGELVANRARHRVIPAAWRKWNDESDRAVWVLLEWKGHLCN
jgi:hypothetical protein